jgi:hypothetical protein
MPVALSHSVFVLVCAIGLLSPQMSMAAFHRSVLSAGAGLLSVRALPCAFGSAVVGRIGAVAPRAYSTLCCAPVAVLRPAVSSAASVVRVAALRLPVQSIRMRHRPRLCP